VALTGHALEGHSEGARQAGCDEFLAKPCLPEALLATVQRMLGDGGVRKASVKMKASRRTGSGG
jgi:CheY-like chemotaxis protein